MVVFLFLLFFQRVASLIAVIRDNKHILIDGIITVGTQPKVKNNFILGVSFGNHLIALVSQILNVTVVEMLPPVKILSIEVNFSCKSIVLDLEPVSWGYVWPVWIKIAAHLFFRKKDIGFVVGPYLRTGWNVLGKRRANSSVRVIEIVSEISIGEIEPHFAGLVWAAGFNFKWLREVFRPDWRIHLEGTDPRYYYQNDSKHYGFHI